MAEVDRLELLIESSSKEAEKSLNGLVRSINKVSQALKTATSSIKTGAANIAEMNAYLGQTAAVQNRVGKSTSSLISRLSKLALAFFGLRKLIRFTWKGIQSSMDYEETVNLFQTVFKKLGEDAGEGFQFAFLSRATDFNREITEALHLDPNLVMNYQARFAQMADSMNLVEESAYNISSAFTMLSADVASLFNINIDASMKKLQSGLAGQIRPLRELGVDISKTSLMQTAWNYGITDSIEKMSAASKVQLRFLTIIQQLRVAMGDMARTINSPANQMRILRQQWDLFTRSVGNIFLPLAIKILPYLNAMAIVLRRIAQSIAEFFGWEMPDWSGVEIYRGVAEDIDLIGEEAEEATKAVKKLRNAIYGFDELNVFLRPTAGAGDVSAPIDSGYSILDEAIAREYEGYMKKFNEEISKMSDKALEIADRIEGPFRNALKLVGLIGIGVASWKVSSGLINLVAGAQSGTGIFGVIAKIKDIGKVSGPTFKLASFFGDTAAYVSLGTVIAGVAATLAAVAARFVDVYKNSEDFRLGLKEVWEVVKDIGAGIGWVFDQISSALGLTNEATRGLLIDLGAIALLFSPAAPFAAAYLIFDGIMWAIRGIGYASRDALEEVDLFGEGISELTKQKVKPFTDGMREIDNAIAGISWGGLVVDEETMEQIKTKLQEVTSMVVNELDADKNQALQNLAPLKNVLDDKTYQMLIQKNEEYYDEMSKQVTDGQARINHIVAKAYEENRSLTEEEEKEIAAIRSGMMDMGVRHLSESAIEYQAIMNRLTDNTRTVTVKQALEIVKNAQLARDGSIKAAEEQYAAIQLEAQRMFDVGMINREEYDAILDAAGKARDEAILAAEEQYSGIVDAAQTKLGELSKYIDWETLEMESKWAVFWNGLGNWISESWSSVKLGFTTLWENIRTFLSEFFGGLGEWLGEGLGTAWDAVKNWFNENVKPIFTVKYWKDKFWSIIDGAGAVLDELKRTFEGWTAKIKTPHLEWSKSDKFSAPSWAVKVLEFFNLPTSIPKLKVNWYAKGGFPSQGEIFGMGEEGPEWLGSIGSRTAVVNTEQITDALRQAMYEGITMAGGSGGGEGSATFQVFVGDEVITRTVDKQAFRESVRSGKPIVLGAM